MSISSSYARVLSWDDDRLLSTQAQESKSWITRWTSSVDSGGSCAPYAQLRVNAATLSNQAELPAQAWDQHVLLSAFQQVVRALNVTGVMESRLELVTYGDSHDHRRLRLIHRHLPQRFSTQTVRHVAASYQDWCVTWYVCLLPGHGIEVRCLRSNSKIKSQDGNSVFAREAGDSPVSFVRRTLCWLLEREYQAHVRLERSNIHQELRSAWWERETRLLGHLAWGRNLFGQYRSPPGVNDISCTERCASICDKQRAALNTPL